MRMSTEPAPGYVWVRVENQGTEVHTFELAWWTEPAGNSAMVAGAQHAGGETEKGEKE